MHFIAGCTCIISRYAYLLNDMQQPRGTGTRGATRAIHPHFSKSPDLHLDPGPWVGPRPIRSGSHSLMAPNFSNRSGATAAITTLPQQGSAGLPACCPLRGPPAGTDRPEKMLLASRMSGCRPYESTWCGSQKGWLHRKQAVKNCEIKNRRIRIRKIKKSLLMMLEYSRENAKIG